MDVILALCLLALAPSTPWSRSADAAPSFATPHSSESWESEESTESPEEVLDQKSLSSKHNFAELLLPYIQREVSAERRSSNSKKNIQVHSFQGSKEHSGAWPRLNSHKKHVVEITPLRGKGRNGKPLAYILAPAKPNVRRALAKRLDKHHAGHEHKDHDGHHARTKSLVKPNESSSQEDSSEEVTAKANKLISLEESIELGSSGADVSGETIIIDKTPSNRGSKKYSSSENASKEESVLSDVSNTFKEQNEFDSSGDSSKDESINSVKSKSPKRPKESTLNKGFSEEEIIKSDKSMPFAERINSVSKDNEESLKSDKSMSIDVTNESKSSEDDTETTVKLDRRASLTKTEESNSSDDVKEEETVSLDKIMSFEESKPTSSTGDTKEDTTSQTETKESSSTEVDTKEETEESGKISFDEPNESRLSEDVTNAKTVKLDSMEKSMSVEGLTTSKESTDNAVHESFNDESRSGHKSDSEDLVVETSAVTLTSDENEESNDRSSDISDKQDSYVNVSDVGGKSSSIDDSSDLDGYNKQKNNENHITEEKTLELKPKEVKNAIDKFTSMIDIEKSSKSLHQSADGNKHLLHAHNDQNHSELEAENNLSENLNVEKSDSQQTQDIQVNKSEFNLNENTENDDQDKNEPSSVRSDNAQEEHDKVDNKLRHISHHNHRHYQENHEHHRREHKPSGSAEDLKVLKTEDQKDSSVRKSHKNADKQGIAIKDDITDTIPEKNTNEVKDKRDEVKSELKNGKETNTKEINENEAAKNFQEEVPNIIAFDESQIHKHSEEISRSADLEQSQSETPTVTSKNDVSESDKSVENTLDEGKPDILTPDNELKQLLAQNKVENSIQTNTIEVSNEHSETSQKSDENTSEESTEHDNIMKSDTSKIDTDIKTDKSVETSETNSVLEESRSEALVAESRTGEPEEKSETGNSSEESKVGPDEDNEVAENYTNLIETKENAENKNSDTSGKYTTVEPKKFTDKSSDEDLEGTHSHSTLNNKSSPSKLHHNGIFISQQDGFNNIWEPASENVIEMIQSSSPPCHSHGEDPSDKAKVHKSYRLSFLFNKK